MTATGLQIRKLTRRDRVVLAGMIRKLADHVGERGVLDILVSDPGASATFGNGEPQENRFVGVGVQLIKLMIEVIESDVSEWFASLLGVTIEEYDGLSFDIEIQVINQLVESEEIGSFFTGALRLSRTMKSFVSRFQNGKTE